jgi:hypothetical protein
MQADDIRQRMRRTIEERSPEAVSSWQSYSDSTGNAKQRQRRAKIRVVSGLKRVIEDSGAGLASLEPTQEGAERYFAIAEEATKFFSGERWTEGSDNTNYEIDSATGRVKIESGGQMTEFDLEPTEERRVKEMVRILYDYQNLQDCLEEGNSKSSHLASTRLRLRVDGFRKEYGSLVEEPENASRYFRGVEQRETFLRIEEGLNSSLLGGMVDSISTPNIGARNFDIPPAEGTEGFAFDTLRDTAVHFYTELRQRVKEKGGKFASEQLDKSSSTLVEMSNDPLIKDYDPATLSNLSDALHRDAGIAPLKAKAPALHMPKGFTRRL